MGLALTRKEEDGIMIGDDIHIKVIKIASNKVRLLIDAPEDVVILRDELIEGHDKEVQPV